MDTQLNPSLAPTKVRTDSRQAARGLGALLRQTPAFETYLKTLKAVNRDLVVQKLSAQIRTQQNALQWNRDDDGQRAADLNRLELELEALPLVKAYREAEAQVKQLFCDVEEMISQEAGVDFAENAKRGGCCG